MFTRNLGIVLVAAGLSALSAQAPAEDPLLRWMNKVAQAQLDARDKEIDAVRTVADAERRKEVVRRKILAALGRIAELRRAAQCPGCQWVSFRGFRDRRFNDLAA